MDNKVLSELQELKKLIQEQSLLKKKVLSFDEVMVYLGVKKWYLYKQFSFRTGIESDCKSLDPDTAVTQFSLKTGRN